MAGFHSNPFALLSSDCSDSDDSGYIEDDPDPLVDLKDQPELIDIALEEEKVVLRRVHREAWELLRRRDSINIVAPDPAVDDPQQDFVPRCYSPFVPPGNWREHSQEIISQHRRECGVPAARDRLESRSPWRSQQTEGKIVRHADFHHFSRGNAPEGQGDIVDLSDGGQIHEKNRFFLIIGRMGGLVLECPIFTYGGKGLRCRGKSTHREYCSIRPLHTSADDFENQNPERRVLDIVSMKGDRRLKESMVVRLSDVRSHDVGTGVDIIGAISQEALKYAARMMLDLISEALMIARQ